MSDETFVQLFWAIAGVTAFIGTLAVLGLIVESRVFRGWIDRINRIEEGRIRQQTDWLINGSGYGRDK